MEPEELREYTVRLQAEGKSGTGFFVAPGLILTCAHVVTDNNGKAIAPINVYWKNCDYTAIVHKLPTNSQVDLALLQLDKPIPEHPWVSLDESVANNDSLYSVGYTDDYPNGEPRDFIYTGLTGDNPPLMTFRDEQVQPGFSGAPLLNKRTSKICGLIKRSRDIYSPLGGRGLPASVIFEYFPKLKPTIVPDNPFVPLGGKIDNANLVFDREKEVKDIFSILNSNSGVALIGDTGIGKSSILQVISERAVRELYQPRQPVYLNLGRCSNDNDFYAELCRLVKIDFDESDPLKTRNFDRAIEQYRLLLILDEIQTMTWDGFTNPVRNHIRALADMADNSPFRLVVAARKPLNVLFPDSSGQVSPFNNVCFELEINPWDNSTIRTFINNRLSNNPISFTESEIIQIITDSKGYPKRVMELCYQTYGRYLQ
ncbi:MAG: serine protease [Xenococcaceae cyanobacterium MO_234.B1]|nr:serine protease [Xenococcaceae cyanobacterium MO_234.B1]